MTTSLLIFRMHALIVILSVLLSWALALLLRQPVVDWLERNGLMKNGKLFIQRWD